MTQSVRDALVSARANKDMGFYASVGAHFASQRTHKQYLRQNHLGKFKKGK